MKIVKVRPQPPPKSFCPCDAGRPQDCKPEEWGDAHKEWASMLREAASHLSNRPVLEIQHEMRPMEWDK